MTLHKIIINFVLKYVENLLKEMELIEPKQKKKEEIEVEKEYVEDDIQNSEIEEKEPYLNTY